MLTQPLTFAPFKLRGQNPVFLTFTYLADAGKIPPRYAAQGAETLHVS
jgi:hypothetical protein